MKNSDKLEKIKNATRTLKRRMLFSERLNKLGLFIETKIRGHVKRLLHNLAKVANRTLESNCIMKVNSGQNRNNIYRFLIMR